MIDDCRLCLAKGVELRDSHFMPRLLYALFRAGDLEPVRFSREAIYPTSKQVKDYVFCADCEQCFNREGENWIRPLLPSVGGPFPLRNRLLKQAPVSDFGDVTLYAAGRNPDIDVLKLIHFAYGVFFKAAVHSWRGDSIEPFLAMPPEEIEVLRLYLFGKADLPKTMALCVTIDSAPVIWQALNEPYRAEPLLGFKRYVFYVPGILFQLCVGDGVQDKIPTCINGYPDGAVLYENVSISMRNTGREELAKAKRTKKLDDIMADIESKDLNIRLGD